MRSATLTISSSLFRGPRLKLSAGYAYVIETSQGAGLSENLKIKLLYASALREPGVDEIAENGLSTQDEKKSVKHAEKQVYGQRIETGKCAASVTLIEEGISARWMPDTIR